MKLAIWHEQFSQIAPPAAKTTSSTRDELHPIILNCTDVSYATIDCGYYSYLVIIHALLKPYGYPGENEAIFSYLQVGRIQ